MENALLLPSIRIFAIYAHLLPFSLDKDLTLCYNYSINS